VVRDINTITFIGFDGSNRLTVNTHAIGIGDFAAEFWLLAVKRYSAGRNQRISLSSRTKARIANKFV
jgi:hypothetical protein